MYRMMWQRLTISSSEHLNHPDNIIMRLMIVDDSSPSRMLLESILQHSGYNDLVQMDSALKAIEYLREASAAQGEQGAAGHADPVDLILMDLNMPEMDGIEATRVIKDDPRFADIPVILVTVSEEQGHLERAFEAGAMDFISKPVDKVELRVRVRSVLRLKQEIDRRKARERELEALNRTLKDLSDQDGLTGVANRRRFDETYLTEWLRCRREGQSLAVLMLDIDLFKAYNDTYGHLQGDACLKLVAQAIKDSLRRPADLVARFGGEEFVVLLPGTEFEGAMRIAEAIHAGVRALNLEHKTSDVAPVVTVSVGLAFCIPDSSREPNKLIHAADTALYDAKRQGRDRIVVGACPLPE